MARGPSDKLPLKPIRFTSGVTESGKDFEFHDDWTKESNSHKLMEEKWIGCTVFVEANKCSLARSQEELRPLTRDKSKLKISWADECGE